MTQPNDPAAVNQNQSIAVETDVTTQKPADRHESQDAAELARQAKKSFDSSPKGLLDRVKDGKDKAETKYTFNESGAGVSGKSPHLLGKYKDVEFSIIERENSGSLEMIFFRKNDKGEDEEVNPDAYISSSLTGKDMKLLGEMVGGMLESGMAPEEILEHLDEADMKMMEKQDLPDDPDNAYAVMMKALKIKMEKGKK